MAPVLGEVARERAHSLRVVTLEWDHNQRTAAVLGVMAVPTLVLHVRGPRRHGGGAERSRRGRTFRARLGEPVDVKVAYGYRRFPRTADSPARLEIFEPEAAVVRRIFDDYVAGGHSARARSRGREPAGPPPAPRLHTQGLVISVPDFLRRWSWRPPSITWS